MKCPICDTELESWDDYMAFILMEREDRCVDGCERYAKYFITGNYAISIHLSDENWRIWQWSHVTPAETVDAFKSEIEQAVTHIRAELETSKAEEA